MLQAVERGYVFSAQCETDAATVDPGGENALQGAFDTTVCDSLLEEETSEFGERFHVRAA
jgi:hypothetical protein